MATKSKNVVIRAAAKIETIGSHHLLRQSS
jgi:hypothetical protein